MQFRLFIISTLLFLVTLGQAQPSLAKEYTIPVIRVEVTVNPDGTIRITEHRTYQFDGSFSWADYRLPFGEGAGYTAIKDIRVSENSTSFINQNSEEPGTFLVQKNGDEIQVKWFYEAEDQQRTFTISYTLEGALVIGPKWAELFWNYLSDNREKDTDSLRIDMELPQSLGTDSIYTWKRGPLANISLQNTATGYTVQATNINDYESVKIRSVFPRSVFNQDAITTNDPDFSLAAARAEEEAFRQAQITRQKRDAKYAEYGQTLAVIVSMLSVLAFIFIYQKFGKRHSARGVSATETIMIPRRLKPAAAGWLMRGRSVSSLHLMATLLDLARNKYFVIKEQEPEKKWYSGEKRVFTIEKTNTQPTENLTGWEQDVADFVSEQIEKGNNRIDKLFAESSYKASKWFSAWKKKLTQYCKDKGWYDEKSFTGVFINMGVQIFLAAFGVLAIFLAGPVGIIPTAITIILLISSLAIIRRTKEGEATYARWKAYQKGLKNAKDHSIGSDLLDKHLIYATAFGLSKKNIEDVFTHSDTTNIVFYWFVFYPGSNGSPADMASTFSTMSTTGAASFPGASAAGGGAGASAGAAGGGAAGGAG